MSREIKFNEMQEDAAEIDDIVFESFAMTHPIEVYDTQKERFCKLVRSKNPEMTDEEITELIEQLRTNQVA